MDLLEAHSVVFIVQCVILLQRIFEFGVLLFSLSPKCNLSEMFYTRDVEDIIVARLAVVSEIAAPQIRAFSCGSMMPY